MASGLGRFKSRCPARHRTIDADTRGAIVTDTHRAAEPEDTAGVAAAAITDTTTEFIYIGDAMCSWCWGFSATIEAIEQRFDIPIKFINGGLRPGPEARPLDDQMRSYLRRAWNRVGQVSGRPFDFGLLERDDGWMYDTELPAIAIVTMREFDDEHVLAFYHRLQRAFYAEGVDITDPMTYPPLLEEFDIDADHFMGLMAGTDMKWRAWEDFEQARAYGVTGFPALLLRAGGELAMVTKGFVPFKALEQPLVEYLGRTLGGALVEGLVCEIGGDC